MSQVQYRIAWPPVTKPMIALFVAFVVLWFGSLAGGPAHDFILANMVVTVDNVVKYSAVWSLFTYAFFHGEFFGILFSAIAVWLFGGELAAQWRAKRFWGMQAVAIVLGGALAFALLWLLDSTLQVRGYQAPAMALVFAYCWRVWSTPLPFFVWQMTGRSLLLLFLGFGVLSALLSGHWPLLVLDGAGILAGFLFSARSLHPRDLRTRFRMWRTRGKLKLVKTPEDDRPARKTADGQYIN